jgi:hypothetical protein
LRCAAHVHLGFGSFSEYVERLCGYRPRSTQEKLRVAEALEELPAIRAALEAGAVHWSAVRELTRVAVPETEREWLEVTRGKTVHQLEALVAGKPRGARPSSPAARDAQPHVLRFEVSGETMCVFREAMSRLQRDSGSSLDDDSALMLMARYVLGGPGDEGRAGYQISLSICPQCGQGSQQANGELIPINPEIVAMAECDGQHLGAVPKAMTVGYGDADLGGGAARAHAGARVSSNAGARTCSRVKPDAGAHTNACVGSSAGAHADARAETNAAGVHTDERAEANAAGVHTDERAEANVGARADARAETNVGAHADARFGAKVGAHADARFGAKVGAHADARFGANVGAHVDARAETNAAGVHTDEANAGARANARVEANAGARTRTRAKQQIPPATRRTVLLRDHRRCCVPGCRNARFVDVHHIRLSSEGGSHQLSNLITLCGAHHRAAHRGELLISGSVPEGVRFRHADGSVYGQPLDPRAVEIQAKAFTALRKLGFREDETRRNLSELRKEEGGQALSLERVFREALARLTSSSKMPHTSAERGQT